MLCTGRREGCRQSPAQGRCAQLEQLGAASLKQVWFVTQHPREPSLLVLFRSVLGISQIVNFPHLLLAKGVWNLPFLELAWREGEMAWFLPFPYLLWPFYWQAPTLFPAGCQLAWPELSGTEPQLHLLLAPLCSFLLKGQTGQQSSAREHSRKGLCVL